MSTTRLVTTPSRWPRPAGYGGPGGTRCCSCMERKRDATRSNGSRPGERDGPMVARDPPSSLADDTHANTGPGPASARRARPGARARRTVSQPPAVHLDLDHVPAGEERGEALV